MSSAVAEIQKDLQLEHRSRGGDGVGDIEFNEAEVCALVRPSYVCFFKCSSC